MRVAFDVRRGSAFAKYLTEDFELLKGSIEATEIEGLEIVDVAPNAMRIRISAPDFTLKISGFDVNRDLVVQSKEITL